MRGERMSDLWTVCGKLGDRAAGIVYRLRLAELDGCHVEFRCTCGRISIPQVKSLIRELGPQRRLSDIVERATCKPCGTFYPEAWLNETHHRTRNGGAEPGWSVQLKPWPAYVESEAAE